MKQVFSLATRVAGIAFLTACAVPAFAQTGGFPGAPATGPARPAGGVAAAAAPAGGGGSLSSGAGSNMAVIDIAYIFKNHPGFKAQMEAMKGEIEQYDAYIRGEQKKMQAERDQAVENFKPNSPEFKKKEEDVARKTSEIQVQMAMKRREFLEKEAAVYYKTYNDLLARVAAFSDKNRIGLVLRFNGDEMDPQDRNSVLQGVNRAVVFQRNLDITEIILQDIVRTAGVTPPRPTPGPGPAPNPNVPRQPLR